MTDKNTQREITIVRITLKDLSFETPMGQEVYERKWQPDYKVKMNMDSRNLTDDQWEVVLTAKVTASLDNSIAFLVEVQQAGVFKITATDSETVSRALGVEAPKLMFPYLREVVDSVAGKGGFPAVRMQPADFEEWYAANQESEKTAGDEPVTAD